MNENLEKIKGYFESILGVDDLKIVVGKASDNKEINDEMSKSEIEEYFNRKKLYFNSETNTLMTFSPCNGSSLKLHPEISTLKCNYYFKWVILFKAYDEDYLPVNDIVSIKKISTNDNVVINEPNLEKVLNGVNTLVSRFLTGLRTGDDSGMFVSTARAMGGLTSVRHNRR